MYKPRIGQMAPSTLLGSALVIASLALGACSSDDDDSTAEPGTTTGADDTSMPAPGTGPGDDVDQSPIEYVIPLTTEAEIPAPNGAEGASGQATLMFDPATRGMTGSVTTDGLSGPPTMAHIHEQPAGELTGPPIVTLVADGTGSGFVLGDDVILTEEQAESLETGLLYVNVHTDLNEAGEIRGQIVVDDSGDSGS